MLITTVGTLKGGVGKSNFLFNIAGLLAEEKKVLIIDVDPQTNLSLNAGVDVTSGKLSTVKNIFEETADIEKIVFKKPIKDIPNLDIIPSHISLFMTEMNLVSCSARENILNNFFKKHTNYFKQYDHILIDTNPSFGIVNQNAFLAADSIILVSDISLNGIQGAELFIALWGNASQKLGRENNIKALVLNNYDRRISLSSELTEYCMNNESISDILLNQVIYNSVKLKDTELEHKTINLLSKNSPIHETYKVVLKELLLKGAL